MDAQSLCSIDDLKVKEKIKQMFDEWSNMLDQLSQSDYDKFDPIKICQQNYNVSIDAVQDWFKQCWCGWL